MTTTRQLDLALTRLRACPPERVQYEIDTLMAAPNTSWAIREAARDLACRFRGDPQNGEVSYWADMELVVAHLILSRIEPPKKKGWIEAIML